jgi:hypothetical protein
VCIQPLSSVGLSGLCRSVGLSVDSLTGPAHGTCRNSVDLCRTSVDLCRLTIINSVGLCRSTVGLCQDFLSVWTMHHRTGAQVYGIKTFISIYTLSRVVCPCVRVSLVSLVSCTASVYGRRERRRERRGASSSTPAGRSIGRGRDVRRVRDEPSERHRHTRVDRTMCHTHMRRREEHAVRIQYQCLTQCLSAKGHGLTSECLTNE